MKMIFESVFRQGNSLYTANLVKGIKVYGERLVSDNNLELREWDPTRSKLAAAIINGLKDINITKGSRILYLGASTGTTVSHVSDIVKEDGIIYALEFAERVFRSLISLTDKRKNIVPLLADVRKPGTYPWIEEVDVVYCDISQPEETLIAIRNAEEFLKKDGILFLAVKSQSIDVTKKPQQVYEEEKSKLEREGFSVLQLINLEPYEEKHAMIVAKK